MPTGTIATVLSVDGSPLGTEPVTETADHPNNYDLALPAGNSGTLTTRTGDGVGVVTLGSGHGIEAADIFDLYWDGGARYAITCDSADATTVTFDDTPAATGDVLPSQDDAIVATERFNANTHIDGDEVQLFGIKCDQRSQCTFYDVGDAIIKQYTFTVANAFESFYQSSGESNPLTGNPITYAMISNGTVTAATMKIRSLEDATP